MIPLEKHDLALLHILSNKDLLLQALKAAKKGADLFPKRYRPHLNIIWQCLCREVVRSKQENRWLELKRQNLVAEILEELKKTDMLQENKERLKQICTAYLNETEYDPKDGREFLKSVIEEAINRKLSSAVANSTKFAAIKKLVEQGAELQASLEDQDSKILYVNPLMKVERYLKRVPKTPIGVSYFDKVTCGGMSEGELCLIAGLMGAGKSMQTIQFVGSQLLIGNCVAWFTYEQPFDQDLMQRLVSFVTGCDLDIIRGTEYQDLSPDIKQKFEMVRAQAADKIISADFSSNEMLDPDDPEDDFSVYSIDKRLSIWYQSLGKLPTYVMVDWLGAAVKNIAMKRGVDIGQITEYIAIANEFLTSLVQVAKKYHTRVIVFHQLDPSIKKSPASRKPTSVELQFIKSATNWVDYAIVQGKRDDNQRCWYICDKNRRAYPAECVIELDGNHARFNLLEGYAPGRNGQFINVAELQREAEQMDQDAQESYLSVL